MAITRKFTTKKSTRPVYSGGMDSYQTGEQEYEYQEFNGWQSDVTGEFYAVDPAAVFKDFNGNDNLNGAYGTQVEQALKQKETDFIQTKETARLNAEYEQQRQAMRQAEEQQRAQFAAEVAAQEKAAADQKAQYESEAKSRELARQAAEEKKQRELGEQREISGKSALEDVERVAQGKDDLVATEDKKVLSADDKAQLFNADAETEEKKKKQSFLETILGKK